MNFLYGTLALSAPLLLGSMGALISEFSGCMALFLDGIINFGAFFCFAGTVLFHSVFLGTIFSLTLSVLFITLAAILIEKLQANRFLAALALNLLATALTSVCSAILFKTRGVLTSELFVFPAGQTRIITTLFSFILFFTGFLLLKYTKLGLYIRISGSDAPVLYAKGINVSFVRISAWILAALFGSAAGCILCVRISSFVPNIASGSGWTALAVVFLGKKNTAAIIAAVLLFSIAQYGANNLQNLAIFQTIPQAFLLALPYLSALLLILLLPQERHR